MPVVASGPSALRMGVGVGRGRACRQQFSGSPLDLCLPHRLLFVPTLPFLARRIHISISPSTSHTTEDRTREDSVSEGEGAEERGRKERRGGAGLSSCALGGHTDEVISAPERTAEGSVWSEGMRGERYAVLGGLWMGVVSMVCPVL